MNSLSLIVIIVLSLLIATTLGVIEAAIAHVSRARAIKDVKDAPTQTHKSLVKVLERREEHSNILGLARTLFGAIAAVSAGFLADSTWHHWGISVGLVFATLIAYMLLAVISNSIGRAVPYAISVNAAIFLNTLAVILGPLTRVLVCVGNRIAPGAGYGDGPYSTEIELREMVDIASQQGVMENEERRMIQNVFDLADTTAREVMVPRPEMVWLNSGITTRQATGVFVRSGLSRLPVIGENVDDIVGIVYLKDVMKNTFLNDDAGTTPIDDILRPAKFIPDSKKLDILLQEMQTERFHLAILIDEFGGVAGLLSIEDILEEIVGEIADEYDQEELAPIEDLADDSYSYRVVARLNLEELVEHIREKHGIDFEFSDEIEDQVETVAGLISFEEGRVPLPGTVVETNGLRLQAEGGRDTRGRVRVRSVLVTLLDTHQE
ncbi:hemolysin family protein [Corynebacterium sp. ES2715-CONJ3]|uniref:hemolysin family protein n=1 Tax=Corynebacterium sp. ES2715-CONJ3 TaxID=2974028 RepID=UPI0021690BF4|nr:hemolysin family protein [Corynebacterium sp. ES2715-CONJ3]MCS4492360.1 hemolysin family protein [Corynebacterium sp. ES2715-CONJ3]